MVRRVRNLLITALLVILTVTAAGCSSIRPSRPVPEETQSSPYVPPARVETATPVVTVENAEPSQIPGCTNNLTFLSDLSVPDGTRFDPGTKIEKRWQVKNSGTCNWMKGYSLRLVGGDTLGAEESQALVPARNGSEVEIQINFTAPAAAGDYDSSWQAFDPEGNAFGDKVFMKITVITP